MDILILRHGIAVPRGTTGYPNDDRPLTDEGVRKMEKSARGIVKVVDGVDLILTSPLQRARKSAEIVATAMHRRSLLKPCDELLPGGSVERLIALLTRNIDRKSIMLVGHNPDLLLCASALLGSTRSLLDLKKGSLCLIRVPGVPGSRHGTIVWHLTSKQLRLIGISSS